MENNNIRTMKFICVDDWGNDVYKCIETNTLYKDLTSREGISPDLYSCANEIDGEPCYPINKNLEIHFEEREPQPTREEKRNYMMLDRLRMDCEYYLGNGNRYAKHLWAGNEKDQIEEMKKIYNSFSDDKKPEWLTIENIIEYENKMVTGA